MPNIIVNRRLLWHARKSAGQGGAAEDPGVPFVPTDLGATLLAWYDFSDTGTITDAGGGAVSQVTDKSGTGNTITQGTGGARPITGTVTLDGKNTIDFDGTDDFLMRASPTLTTTATGWTVVVVRKMDSSTHSGLFWIRCDGGSSGDACSLGRDNGDMWIGGDRTNTSAVNHAGFADSDNTNWNISSGTHNQTSREIFHNGTSRDTDAGSVGSAAVDDMNIGINLSRDRSTVRWHNGPIAQVFVLSGTDATNRQKIEGYAAWQYSATLVPRLDSGHPYKSAPPTSSGKIIELPRRRLTVPDRRIVVPGWREAA